MSLGEVVQSTTVAPTKRMFKPPLSPVRGVPQAISPVATIGSVTHGAKHSDKKLAPIPMKSVAKVAEAFEMLEKRGNAQLDQMLSGAATLQADDGIDPSMVGAASKAVVGGSTISALSTFKNRNNDTTYKARKTVQKYLKDNPQLNSGKLGDVDIRSNNVLARAYVGATPQGTKILTSAPKSTALALRELDTATRMGLREDSIIGKLRNRAHPAKLVMGRAGFMGGLAGASQVEGDDPTAMAARVALPALGGVAGSVPELATKLRSSKNAVKAMETMPHLKPSDVIKGKKTLATSLLTGVLGTGGWAAAGVLSGHMLNNESVGL